MISARRKLSCDPTPRSQQPAPKTPKRPKLRLEKGTFPNYLLSLPLSIKGRTRIQHLLYPNKQAHCGSMGINNSTQNTAPPVPKQIFILSGQSNMAGRGGVTKQKKWDGILLPECYSNPSILRLSATLRWEEAREPLHVDIDAKKVCGVGPGMAFANALRKRLVMAEGQAMGLVPCAVGGTAIKEWARGKHLYESMVKRAKEAVKEGGEIKALLWYQGESDTSTHHDAEVYRDKMETLIRDVREDLCAPSLPIIQVAIASGDGKNIEKVREAQLGINLPNVVCVDAKGLPLKEDNLHLTTEAQVQLGLKLADAYLNHFAAAPPQPPSLP